MGLLREAAIAWLNLQNKSYVMLLGRRHTSVHVQLVFAPSHFFHLAGMQKLNSGTVFSDIFGISYEEAQKSGWKEKFPLLLANNVFDDSPIEESDEIRGRLESILLLETTLDGSFDVFQFLPERCRPPTKIIADYVIRPHVNSNQQADDEGFFLFWKKEGYAHICNSIFRNTGRDFTANQSKFTVLVKEKFRRLSFYQYSGYRPTNEC